ncbi:hypothetical protein D9M69_563720 [compost metagenome]
MLAQCVEERCLRRRARDRRLGTAAAVDRFGRVFKHAFMGREVFVRLLVEQVRPVDERTGDAQVPQRQGIGGIGQRLAPQA